MFCRFVRPVLTDGCHGDGGEHGRAQQYRGADDGRRRTMAAVAAAHDFRSARFFTRLSFSRGFFCANTSIARHNRRDPPTALPGRSRPRPDVSNRVRVLCPARSGFAFGTESVAAAATTVAENVRESRAAVDGSLSSARRPRTLIVLPPPADRSRRHCSFRGLDGIRKGKCPHHQHVCRVEEGYRCRRARLSLSLTSKTLAAADRCGYGRKKNSRGNRFCISIYSQNH